MTWSLFCHSCDLSREAESIEALCEVGFAEWEGRNPRSRGEPSPLPAVLRGGPLPVPGEGGLEEFFYSLIGGILPGKILSNFLVSLLAQFLAFIRVIRQIQNGLSQG